MSGRLFGVFAFLVWGLASTVLLRHVPLPGPVASCFGMGVAAVALLIARRDRPGLVRAIRARPLAIIALAIAFALCSMTYQWAIKTTTVSNAVLTHSLQPLLTCLVFAPIFLKLRPDRRALIALGLGVVGMAVLLGPELHWRGARFGIVCGTASAIFFAWFNVQLPKLDGKIDRGALLFWCLAVGTIVILPFALAQPTSPGVGVVGWSYAVVYGLLNFLLANLFYWRSAARVPITHVSVLAYIEPVVGITAAALWLHEPLTAHAVGGGVLILASGAVVLFGNKTPR